MKTKTLTEEQLVLALQGHLPADFAKLYEAYSAALYGVLLRLVKDSDLAKDLLQDAFLKIWSNSQNYDPRQGRLFTWLLTITRHVAMDELRARKIRSTASTYLYEHDDQHVQPQVNAGMLDRALLSPLAPVYQTVVELMYYRNYTGQEAAAYLQIPLGTVKTRVRKALQDLKTHFNADIKHYQGFSAQ